MNELILSFEGPLDGNIEDSLISIKSDYSTSRLLSGGIDIVDVIIYLTPTIIYSVTHILTTLVKNKKNISIKFDDIEIKDAKIEDIERLIKAIKKYDRTK